MAIGQEHTYPIDATAEFKTPTRLAWEGQRGGLPMSAGDRTYPAYGIPPKREKLAHC